MHVQYGCGFTAPAGWTNFDASMTLRWERVPFFGDLYTKNAKRFPPTVRYGDIVAGLPVPDRSCTGVFASHVLEHLCLNDFHVALENTKKILKEGGVFRLVVPDLESFAREYLQRVVQGEATANGFFMNSTCLGTEEKIRGFKGMFFEAVRTSKHLWMWDTASITSALEKHGFKHIRKCTFGDCDDRMFELVEEEDRFQNAVAMEARA